MNTSASGIFLGASQRLLSKSHYSLKHPRRVNTAERQKDAGATSVFAFKARFQPRGSVPSGITAIAETLQSRSAPASKCQLRILLLLNLLSIFGILVPHFVSNFTNNETFQAHQRLLLCLLKREYGNNDLPFLVSGSFLPGI